MASAYHLMHDYKDHEENPLQPIDNHSLHPRSPEVENIHEFSRHSPDAENAKFSMAEEILHTPVSSRMQQEMDISDQDHDVVHDSILPSPHESVNDLEDSELSPRLTNFIKSGVVPESPINVSPLFRVSADAMASDEEEDAQEGSSYEDSFIDDGLNPTSSNTQAGSSRPDMMAIYRRSLLTQSPFPRLPDFPTNYSPDSLVESSKLDESGSSAGTKHGDAPQTGFESSARNSESAGDENPKGLFESRLDNRKRKLSFHQDHSLPMVNLDKEFASHSGAAHENSSMDIHVERPEESRDIFEDDQFFEGIDLDAVEEEATKLLKLKSERATQKTTPLSEPIQQNLAYLGSPSFDLGI